MDVKFIRNSKLSLGVCESINSNLYVNYRQFFSAFASWISSLQLHTNPELLLAEIGIDFRLVRTSDELRVCFS